MFLMIRQFVTQYPMIPYSKVKVTFRDQRFNFKNDFIGVFPVYARRDFDIT